MTDAPHAIEEGLERQAAPLTNARPRRRSRSLMIGLAIGAIVAATCGAIASRVLLDRAHHHARVVRATRSARPVRIPHEVCKSEEVRHARGEGTYTTTEEHCVTVYEIEEEP